MPKSAFNWKVAGAAGEGIKSTGMMFSKTCLRSGLHTFDYTEYPSLIRGGHNTYEVLTSREPVYSPEIHADLLVALNENAVKYHHQSVDPQGLIIYDGEDSPFDLHKYPFTSPVLSVPFFRLAKESGGDRVMANNVALGVSIWLSGLDLQILNKVITDNFKGKKPEITQHNQQAAQAGYTWAQNNLKPLAQLGKPPINNSDTLTMTGNEALALGAIAGGMQAYLAYPMTPASSILHSLADWQKDTNIFVKHVEDEIGVINMALGLSFTGIRAAVGTAGGGFCYMTEAIGLSGIAELPLVIFEAQRPGPAVGMPTWTAQGDLLFVINASQDEFPRIVLAPGDVKEAFNQSALAFDLAEDYQLPVIIMSDKHLSESSTSLNLDTNVYSHTQSSFDSDAQPDVSGFYPRYKVTGSGVSLRSIPGQSSAYYLCDSYEHDVYGLSSETAADRQAQMDKRMKKLELIKTKIPAQFYSGSPNSQITLIGWGSTKGALLAAQQKLQEQGIDTAVLNLSWLWPFPVDQIKNILETASCPVIIEGNFQNQLALLIRQQTGINIYHKRTKYDGRPFYPSEIVAYVYDILKI
jgi:2-oxoglutarate ferredoxin oxidoreductase subunit alpha